MLSFLKRLAAGFVAASFAYSVHASELTDMDPTDANNTSFSSLAVTDAALANTIDNIMRAYAGAIARALTGAAPVDDTFTFGDPGDLTKRLRLDAGNVTAGQTRVFGVPDSNGTLVISGGSFTLESGTGSTTEGRAQWNGTTDRLVIGDGAAVRTFAPVASGTAVASTSGATVDFTSIPAGVTEITITVSGVSSSGTDDLLIRIGDSGGIETSGYLGGKTTQAGTVTRYTGAWGWGSAAAANVHHGSFTLTLVDAATFTWVIQGSVHLSNTDASMYTSGSKPLSATLDRVQLLFSGSNTFDAGLVNIRYH